MALSPFVDALLKVFEEKRPHSKEGGRFSVSRTVSLLAVLYEKARNAVEFRAEHLVRRAAIERILKRRVLINGGSHTIADNLVLELLWARYIDSSLIDDAKVGEIQAILDRYMIVKQQLFAGGPKHKGISWDTVLGLASAEIDEALISGKKRDALNNFVFQAIKPKIKIPNIDEQRVTIQTYIAVDRAFAQSDEALIAYDLLKIIQPSWIGVNPEACVQEIPTFVQTLDYIMANLRDPFGEPLQLFVRRHAPSFLLIRDFLLENGDKARAIVDDSPTFEAKLSELATHRYQETGAKVRRAIVRSFIYIFLTKMVFAVALEVPFDLYIAHRVSYLAILINMIFPPLLLILVAGLFNIPGPENTRKLVDTITKIFYNFDEYTKEGEIFILKARDRRPILTAIFSFLYLVTFIFSFGVISFILTKLQFNIASQIIFVFFVTLVSFFAYRIQQSAREYALVYRQRFFEPFLDFFFLPILRAGHLLSREIAKINVLIFFFDFILEAPLKVIFEVVEEWIRFIRTKKEEII